MRNVTNSKHDKHAYTFSFLYDLAIFSSPLYHDVYMLLIFCQSISLLKLGVIGGIMEL